MITDIQIGLKTWGEVCSGVGNWCPVWFSGKLKMLGDIRIKVMLGGMMDKDCVGVFWEKHFWKIESLVFIGKALYCN